MATKKVLAMTTDGRMTYCSCAPDQRGKGRCNHVIHQEDNEEIESFIKRVSAVKKKNNNKKFNDNSKLISPISVEIIKGEEKILERLSKSEELQEFISDVLKLDPQKITQRRSLLTL